MKEDEIEKAKTFIICEIIEYVPNAMISKTIISKVTGIVSVSAFDSGEILMEGISRFDTFIQAIDGSAEVIINNNPSILTVGQGIIIPAHTRSSIKANIRFKMISTTIKSGYEEVIP
jgi:hypothetical protein